MECKHCTEAGHTILRSAISFTDEMWDGIIRTDVLTTLPLPHSDCNKNADEEIELIEVQQARVVHIQHIKNTIDFLTTQVCCTTHEHVELDVYRKINSANGAK